MRRDSRAPRRTTWRCRASRSPAALPRFAAPSSRARHGDSSGDDLFAQRLETRANVVGNQRAIVVVVDVADALLAETELEDAALERAVAHFPDRLVHRDVDALHHRRQDVIR